MTPLIDGDVLLHELGWSGEFKDKESGDSILLPFDQIADMLDDKISLICEDVQATTEPVLYLTNTEWLTQYQNKNRKREGLSPVEFVHTFRYDIAKTRPYKGNRNNPKPFHFYNIAAYMLGNYNVVIAEDGLEADDMLCIDQVKSGDDSIICSRDKDLRICPGWHYSWECGKQRSIGPNYTDRLGRLEKHNGKTLGYGLKFFYYQMLVGDTADYIPGLQGWGDVGAFNLIEPLSSEIEIFKVVKGAYLEKLGKEAAKEYFMEQANLLWMIQEKGKMYEIPKSI